jgi:F-type H+-transporting ATPase subunit epsilon
MPTPTLPTKIKLEVVTPDRLLLSEEIDEVTIPGTEGYLGILPGHLPLLTMIGTGVLSYRKGTQKLSLAASGGFAEVLPDRVIIMADTVERPEEIDLERARAAKERAERQLTSKENVNVQETMTSMMRAQARIEVAQSGK